MHVLVAGATGVVGRRLVPLLLAEGHDVSTLTRREESVAALRAAGTSPHVVDVLDRDRLTAVVGEVRPDVVVHQLTDLARLDLADNARVRDEGTANLVAAAASAGVERIVAQSVAWAYRPGAEPADEATPLDLDAAEPRRTTVRGVDALEQAVRALPHWVVLRYGMFYGPDTWFARDGARAHQAASGDLVADASVTSFVHVDDAAAAAVAALTWPNGAVNVCDDEPAAGHDWVPAFCRAVGAPEPPRDDAERPGWARGATNVLAREGRGWTPRHRTWREGFRAL